MTDPSGEKDLMNQMQQRMKRMTRHGTAGQREGRMQEQERALRGVGIAAAAAVAGALVLGAAPAVSAMAAAPGSAAYTQAVNTAIMYSEPVDGDQYATDRDWPMDLQEAISYALSDARPKSVSRAYLSNGNADGQTSVQYSWNGAGQPVTCTMDTDGWYDTRATWKYTWDGNGYLSGIDRQEKYSWSNAAAHGGCEVALGADGRPAALNASEVAAGNPQYLEACSYGYDAAGRIIAMNVTRVNQSTGEMANYVNQYAYNANGTLRKVTVGDGSEFLIFHYDGAGQLAMSFQEMTNGGTDMAIQYHYDAAGRPDSAICYRDSEAWWQQGYAY